MITRVIWKDSLSGTSVLAWRNGTSLQMDQQSGPSSVGHKMTDSLLALEQTFWVFMRHRYVFIDSLCWITHIHVCSRSLTVGCDAASDAVCAVLNSRVQCLWNYKIVSCHFKHTVKLVYWAEMRIRGMTPIFNVQVLCDVMSWWWVNSCQHFEQACCLCYHFHRSWKHTRQVRSEHWLTIYHHITEDMNLHQHCCENLRSHMTPFLF